MTLISARSTDEPLNHELLENNNTTKIQEQLNFEDTGTDLKYAQREQLSLEDFPSLTGSSTKTHRKYPNHDGPVPRTSRQNDVDFLKQDVVFFSCDKKCRTPTRGSLNSDHVKEGDKKPRPELRNNSLPSVQTQEERMHERSKKDRERSLRTRRRNTARLKLLEENCVHLSRENNILRDLARSLAGQDDEMTAKLLSEYRLAKSEKPEQHKLMHPESYYMNLLLPLSITASANGEDTHLNTQNKLEAVLTPEYSVTPQASKNADIILNGKNGIVQQEVARGASKASLQVNFDGSKSAETGDVCAIDDSVFADPGYGDGKQLGFSLEEVCSEPLLSAEEIVELVEQGARAVELPLL